MSEFMNKERQQKWKKVENKVHEAKEDYYKRYQNQTVRDQSEGRTSLTKAAGFNGNTDTVRTLLEHGANVNTKTSWGRTSLIKAAQIGNTDTVRILLEHGADVNTQDESGETSLIKAARNRETDIVKILLQHGADVNSKSKKGRTALDTALEQPDSVLYNISRAGVVKLLRANGAKRGKEIL